MRDCFDHEIVVGDYVIFAAGDRNALGGGWTRPGLRIGKVISAQEGKHPYVLVTAPGINSVWKRMISDTRKSVAIPEFIVPDHIRIELEKSCQNSPTT